MASNPQSDEIKELLTDICAYLQHEILLSDYQNTTASNFDLDKSRGPLLARCKVILRSLEGPSAAAGSLGSLESSYLDMTRKKPSPEPPILGALSNEYVVINGAPSAYDTADTDAYDICAVVGGGGGGSRAVDESDADNCPYSGLPAAHLTIKKSPKQGQLSRIEKRFFLEQSKKYFCGIVGDWLLCYGDGAAAVKPSFCVHLAGVGIEHHGDGKRRDLCFQIASPDAAKRFVFQATSEIETKIWIHAIEAVRGEGTAVPSVTRPTQLKFPGSNNLRKLPTPPVQAKFHSSSRETTANSEDIYEEPCPLYNTTEIIATIESPPPPTPFEDRTASPVDEASKKLSEEIVRYDYDVPKRSNRQKSPAETAKIEVQSKIKDALQLLAAPEAVKPADCPKFPTPREQLPSTTEHGSPTAVLPASTTPVRKWFLGRSNKSSAAAETPAKIAQRAANRTRDAAPLATGPTQIPEPAPTTPRGEMVNRIISQWEANGRLPIFKIRKNPGRTRLSYAIDANYESVNSN